MIKIKIPFLAFNKIPIAIDTLKTIRIALSALCFICIMVICNMDTRQAQQITFTMAGICLFGFLLDNIWVSLFLWWTIFLHCFFKFNVGQIYVTNIFLGCVIYYLAKASFNKKEHAQYFINAILWLAVLNLLYSALQPLNLDFIYMGKETLLKKDLFVTQPMPNGFMSNSSVMAALLALCVPLLLARKTFFSVLGGILMFIPLWILRSSLPILAATIGGLFVAWFYIPKNIWYGILTFFIVFLAGFLIFRDMPGVERFDFWKLVMQDAMVHPVTGWGPDSFKNMTELKGHLYFKNLTPTSRGYTALLWDNPHNLYISMFFEFGIIGVIILGGYIRGLFESFRKILNKNPDIIGLAGFAIIFLIISGGHFPIFLARVAVFAIPAFAIFEVLIKQEIKQEA